MIDEIIINSINQISKPNYLILDIGCGNQKFSNKIKKGKVFTLDIWKKFKPDILYNLNNISLPFKSNSIDIVLLLDVIEHLEKDKGKKVIKEAKRITRKYIIILTPLWWDKNEKNIINKKSPYYQNPYNLHKSLWILNDFNDWKRISQERRLAKYFFGVWDKRRE